MGHRWFTLFFSSKAQGATADVDISAGTPFSDSFRMPDILFAKG